MPAGRLRRVRPRVATRYVRVTQDFFAEAGEQADVLAFQAPALAVRLGLADGVVELRGRLAAPPAPAWRERAEVAACSARLVCGRAARTLAGAALEDLVERLRTQRGGVVKELVWTGDARGVVAELRAFAPPAVEVAAAVAAIVADVRERGDAAVREHTLRLDGVELPERYAEPPERLREALAGLAPAVREALEVAAANIRAYHEREAPRSWRETLPQGQVVGQEIVPWRVAGLYVPGGLADYPSSVLMTAIPARWPASSASSSARRPGAAAARPTGSPPPARSSASTTSCPSAAPRPSRPWPSAPLWCRAATSSSGPATPTSRRPSAR